LEHASSSTGRARPLEHLRNAAAMSGIAAGDAALGDARQAAEQPQNGDAASTVQAVPPDLNKRMAELFRDGPRHHRQRSRGMEYFLEDRLHFCEFLRGHTCYDLLPISSKVIVFDTALQVRKAFYAMLQNGPSKRRAGGGRSGRGGR